VGQLRYAKLKKKILPPHNCRRFYQDFGVCFPDNLCDTIKNPLQYAKKKTRLTTKKEAKRPKLTKEQLEMRRKYREKQKNS
jgi:DNA primase large subunit